MVRLLCLFLLLPVVAAAQCWVYQKSGLGVTLHSVAVLDSLHRVAVGDDGTILRTTDGGASWARYLTSAANDLRGVAFATPQLGLAVGTSGIIFRTTDGGASWSKKLNATVAWLVAVAFPDTLHAYVLGDWIESAILRSSDGGKTWAQDDIAWIGAMSSVAFADSQNGIFSGDARLASTTNGAATWDIIREGDAFGAVSMPSLDNAAMAGGGAVFASTDGLLTQQLIFSASGYQLHGVCFTGRDTGYAVGQGFADGEWGGVVFRTTNGGSAWDTTFVPGTYLRAVHVTPGGQVTAVGDNGTIISLTAECVRPPAPALLAPADGAAGVPLLTTETARQVAALAWNYPAFVDLRGSQVQIGTDPAFSGGVVHDTLVPLAASRIQLQLDAAGLAAGTTYYWRVRMQFRDSSLSDWSPPSHFTTASGIVRGTVFSDADGNGVRDGGDPPLAGWKVDIGGAVRTSVLTDSQGVFILRGVAGGVYRVWSVGPNRWLQTTAPETAVVTIGSGDSLDAAPFGFLYLKNGAAGVVFNDRNENGVRDAGEEGLPGWTLRLDGAGHDSALTDASGAFLFGDVAPGPWTVTLAPRPGWEQLVPVLGLGYSLSFSGYGTLIDSVDFSAHEIPPRVKNRFWITDSTRVNGRAIWWGVRPSATDGIWGVDPAATISDFAEGEFEIPPPTFGVFDARFVQPPGTEALYANGSWTDMQAYSSPDEIDTFAMTFQPGYLFSGGYPMHIRWNKEEIAASFAGPVTLGGPIVGTTDMKAVDSLDVSNPSVGSLLVIAQGPVIPAVGVADARGLPAAYALEQNFPNPFNPATVIRYSLPASSAVELEICDLLGRHVATLAEGTQEPGSRAVTWHGADDGGRPVAAGIYFCTLRASPLVPGPAPFAAVRKLLLVK